MRNVTKTILIVALSLFFGPVNFSLTNSALADFDLKGTVVDANGSPIADVVVAMYTAHPRVGSGIL